MPIPPGNPVARRVARVSHNRLADLRVPAGR